MCLELGRIKDNRRIATALHPAVCHVFSGAMDGLLLKMCHDKPGPLVIDLNDVFCPPLFDYLHERFEPTEECLGLADGFCARDRQAKFAERFIAAYALAIEQGADAIEPDLVMTKDGVLIVRHDRYETELTDNLRVEQIGLKLPDGAVQRVSDKLMVDLRELRGEAALSAGVDEQLHDLAARFPEGFRPSVIAYLRSLDQPSYAFDVEATERARCSPSARLYSLVPRLSQWPSTSACSVGSDCSISAFWRSSS